jgi:hypothetical protein
MHTAAPITSGSTLAVMTIQQNTALPLFNFASVPRQSNCSILQTIEDDVLRLKRHLGKAVLHLVLIMCYPVIQLLTWLWNVICLRLHHCSTQSNEVSHCYWWNDSKHESLGEAVLVPCSCHLRVGQLPHP